MKVRTVVKWLTIRIALLTLFVVVGLFLLYWLAPRPELQNYIPYSTAYFDNDNRLLRLSLATDDRYRLHEALDEIAPSMIHATILYEDQDYYEHGGVDVFALFRAAWDTYVLGGRRIGASTITMQVARLRWGIPSRKLSGKLYQIARAIQLSRHYSKKEILEAYLNLAPYGRNIEGVAAASLIYFNKRPSQLSLPEALTLAIIPQNPNKRNPTSLTTSTDFFTVRERLFERWLEHYPQDVSRANQLELPLAFGKPEDLPFLAPHFVDYMDRKRSQWDSGYVSTSLN